MKAETVNATLWGVLTVGGIVTASLSAGPMQENAARLDHGGYCVYDDRQECDKRIGDIASAYKLEHALVIGGAFLSLGGLVRLWPTGVAEQESHNTVKKHDE